MEPAARAIGLQIQILKASTSREIDAAFATLVRDKADAFVVTPDPFLTSPGGIQLANLAMRHVVPTVGSATLRSGEADDQGRIRNVGSVAHQSAGFGKVTVRICRGDRVARRHVGQLDTPVSEEGVGSTKRASGRSRTKDAKAASISRLVLALRTWICSPIARAADSTSLNVVSAARIGRIDEHGHTSGCGHQLTQELQPLCHQLSY